MKIVIATDAWKPQVNGVVTTLGKMGEYLQKAGHEVLFITPQDFNTIPCPTYPEIKLAIFPKKKTTNILNEFKPDAIHIATEGPIGQTTRKYCLKNNIKFTSSYHTQFPEYLRLRLPIPLAWTYNLFRRFHDKAERTLVPTPDMQKRLTDRGFKNVEIWSRGVETETFKPRDKNFLTAERPISMYMGRVAVEKNMEAYLDLDIPGTKYVVGDGPDKVALKEKYPNVVFTGFKHGEELAQYLAAADVFVFPSLTDTYGLVMLEAMACGVPVAAFPVTGPIDVVKNGITGILNDDLKTAISEALNINSQDCIDFAKNNSWEKCASVFFNYLHNNYA